MLKTRLFAAVLAGCLLAGASSAMAAENAHYASKVLDVKPERAMVRYIPGIVYEQVPSRGYQNVAMEMDMLKPDKKEKMPAIIYVTGGGFINANRANAIQERMRLAEEGYVVVSITYRVAPAAVFPEPLEDVKAAVRYLKANAGKFNIDKNRIGIMGGSAGGYLAAMAGVTSGSRTFDKGENLQETSDIKCVVDLYGVSDLTRIGDDYSAEVQQMHRSAGATEALWVNGSPVFGGKDGGIFANPEGADRANPLKYINKRSAPMLLMHGDADTVVSPSQSDILYQELKKNNIEAERYIVRGAAHGGQYWVQDGVLDIIVEFFDRYLKK